LKKLKEIVPINNIIISASEFYRLFNEKFPEVASTNHGINISSFFSDYCQLIDEKFPGLESTDHDKKRIFGFNFYVLSNL